MTIKRIITIAIMFALLTVIGVQRVQMVRASTKPNTPVTFSMYENGQQILAREYICNHLKISILGPHTITGDGHTWTVVNVYYHDRPDTRVGVEVIPLQPRAHSSPTC